MMHKTRRAPALSVGDRKLRFSHRYKTWQVQDRVTRDWRNVNPEMARCYAIMGMGVDIESTEVSAAQRQFEML